MLPEGLHSSSATPPTTTAGYYACESIPCCECVYLCACVFAHNTETKNHNILDIMYFLRSNAITRSIHHILALLAMLT